MANVTLKKDVSHKRESCIANFFLAFSTPPHGLFDLLTPPHTSSHPLTPPQASSLPLITSSLPPQALFDFTSHFRNLLALHQNGKETFHWRLKGTFNILGHRFRHNQKTAEKTMALHQKVVHACVVLIQYDYENGHPPLPLH